jgi:hypothetical protein
MGGESSGRRRAGSWRFPKSVACIIATSGKRPDLASPDQSGPPARHARHHQAVFCSSRSPTSFPWEGRQARWLEKADWPTLAR